MKQLLLSIVLMAIINHLSAQNVGIGTETPQEKLEVNGNLRFTFGSDKFISISTGPSQSLQGNNLTVSAGSLSPQTLSGVGGSLELQGGNFRNPGTGGGNIFFTAGRNSLADGSAPNAKHGFIVFRGGASYQGQTIVEHARMDGTTGNWGFGTSTTTSKVNIQGLGGLHVNSLNFGIGAGAIDWIAGNFGGIAGNRVVMGLLNTVASIGAHNEALNAWDNLAINPGGGNVGIGTNTPGKKLEVSGTGGLKVNSTNPGSGSSDWIAGNMGGTAGDRVVIGNLNGTATMGAQNNTLNAWSNLAINPGGGNVGIGMATPHATLQLSNIIANRRFVLWEDINNDHQYFGLGINPSVMRYQVPGTGASHIFFAGTSASTSVELMRIQGNGRVGIGTAPAATFDVNGNFKMGSSGTVLNNIIKITVGFGSIPVGANNTNVLAVGPIAGAVKNSTVFASPSVPLPAGLSIGFSRVPADGTVEIFLVNGTNALINSPVMDVYISIIN